MAPKVTPAQARSALQGYKRQRFPVDPDDEAQINMYIEMRAKFARVSPSNFLKFMETGQEVVKSGTNSKMSFWAVPKNNFSSGLPKKIKAAEVADGEFAELAKSGLLKLIASSTS